MRTLALALGLALAAGALALALSFALSADGRSELAEPSGLVRVPVRQIVPEQEEPPPTEAPRRVVTRAPAPQVESQPQGQQNSIDDLPDSGAFSTAREAVEESQRNSRRD